MVSPFALWLPILLSGAAAYLVSSLLHMVLTYHQSDFSKLNDEDKIMDALRPFNMQPGSYVFPYARDQKERSDAGFQARIKAGPVGFMTVFPNREFNMGATLGLWFVYCVLVSVFVAYVARMTLPVGTEYLLVMRVTSVTAFLGYGLALLQNSIWYKRKWSATFKALFDALIYALVTGGLFGWLWPTGV